jgi:FAD/FMN-containing dehydrogenase/Fe-S oxidoreductase
MTSETKVLPIVNRNKAMAADRTAGNVEAGKLEAALRARVKGEVRFDDGSRAMYSTDASNYRQVPIGVVIPRDVDDVVATVAACRDAGAPILARGGGTSLAGQCCNVAVVLDFSKYMNRILELDPERKIALVQPGLILDDLRNEADRYHLTFGPDPATHSHNTLGGMIGNNSCGVHSVMAGKTVDNIEELEVLTYDGERMRVGWTAQEEMEDIIAAGGRRGEIYAQLKSLRDRYWRLIRARYPDIPRRVSGYNLDQLLPDEHGRFNLARALVGSECTCALVLEATVKLVHSPAHRVLLLLGYPDVFHAGDHVPEILEFKPIGLEGLDEVLKNNVDKKGEHRRFLPMLPEGKGWLMVEFGGDTHEEAVAQAQKAIAKLQARADAPSYRLYTERQDQANLWKIRESGLGASAFVPGEPPTWTGWEDAAVHPNDLGRYLRDFYQLLQKHNLRAALYGHFGQACVHCRINFDLFTDIGVKEFRVFVSEAADLVVSYNGSLSGEHGDGQARAEFLPKMYGPELIEAFREFKSIWDPQWRMNPGKVVEPYRIDENLRLGADYDPWDPPAHFQFPNDHGSFAHAALRCVGVGKCRRMAGEGTMCPSYMVTREEKHTTRGRAHLLWEMLQGNPIGNRWRDENVKEALDLCLSCKGCKSDCPVNVDIATYKAEFLSHYYEGRLRPRSAYAFGLIDQWARVASRMPGLVNLVTQTPGLREVAKLIAGMPRERDIPPFAPVSFREWFCGRRARKEGRPKVILWPDTFNNYFFPETARAAVEVLEAAGFRVVVPTHHLCCGRPLYDFGMLDRAKSYLEKVLRVLGPEIAASTPMVVLEPSCASVFRDELNELFPHDPRAQRLMQNTFLLSEFLETKAKDFPLPRLDAKALVHGHCHHKSIMKFTAEQAVLERLGLDVDMPNTGCCGMAGSFGFEKDKYEVSVAAGERVLLPAVRKARLSTLIVADGFSCREQIAQATNRHALHLAEIIQMAMHAGPAGPGGIYPERKLVREREQKMKASMKRAAIGLTAGVAAGALLWALAGKNSR